MGGAWVADVQRHVWAEADRYGVAREHDALPASVRWRFGEERDDARAAGRRRRPRRARARRRGAARGRPPPRRRPPARRAGARGPRRARRTSGSPRSGSPPRVRALLGFWVSACASAPPAGRVDARLPALDLRRRPPRSGRTSRRRCSAGASRRAPPRCTRRSPPTCAARSCSGPRSRRSSRTPTRVAVTTAARRPPHARAAPSSPCRSACCPSIAFSPPLSAAKRRAAAENHAGQGVKAWVLARGVPDDLCAMGHGTRLDFAGAIETPPDGVLLVCFGPSAADARRDRRRGGRRRGPRARARGRRRRGPRARLGAATPTAAAPGRSCARARSTARGPALRAPEGRVHFAGAHTALRWPSFMDGAIESGHRVADEVAQRMQSAAERRKWLEITTDCMQSA